MPLRFPALLRRAIEGGAVSRVARDIFSGLDLPAIRERLRGIFGVEDPANAERIIDLGSQAREAGRLTDLLSPGESPVPIPVPIIPHLPAELFAGGRQFYEVEVEWVNTDTGQTGLWFLRVPALENLGPDDLEVTIGDMLNEDFSRSPGTFGGGAGGAGIEIRSINTVDGQRRF